MSHDLPSPAAITPADPAAVAAKARFWDRHARKYAAAAISDTGGYEATLRRVQSLLSPHDSVREIGCGTGTTALRLAPFTRRLLATDVSAPMIAIAEEKLAAQPVAQLQFAVADADGPVAEPGSFDAVLAFNLLHLVSDLDGALGAAVQCLRPGGLLISKTPCIAEMHPVLTRVALPLAIALGRAPRVLRFDAPALQAAFLRQGLEVVAVERHGTRGRDFRVFILAHKPA